MRLGPLHPSTYTAPAPEQRTVTVGNTVSLGAVELDPHVSSCGQQAVHLPVALRAITPSWPIACLWETGEEIFRRSSKTRPRAIRTEGRKTNEEPCFLASLIAAASTGCIISSDSSIRMARLDHPNARQPRYRLPPGFTTAALYSQPVDIAGNAVGQPIIDLFDCAAGEGTTAPLPPDLYKMWIEITNDSNTVRRTRRRPQRSSTSPRRPGLQRRHLRRRGILPALVGPHRREQPGAADVADAGIDDPNTSGVEINSTLSGTTAAATDQFNCTDHFGITGALPAGDYTVSIDAFTDAQGAIGEPVNIPTATIGDHNQITDLGSVMLPIDGL